jgi:hypothetical protein
MRLNITNHHTPDGREFFYWTLLDGPDGADEVTGFGTDLCEVFSKVIEWRHRIARDYTEEQSTTNNETDD